jgi:quinol monooxygenase YgiN
MNAVLRADRILVFDGRVPPGSQRPLETYLREARGYYESPGGIRVRLWWDRTDPDRFREVIEYADAADEEADDERVRADPTMRAYLTRWHALLAEPPRVRRWREIDLRE